MRTLRLAALGALLLALGACGPSFIPRPENGFVAREIKVGTETYRYQVYLPLGWSADRRWPVILYLHGGGEIGSDNLRQTQDGLGPALFRHRADYPFVVVMPQCRRRRYWAVPDMDAMVMAELRAALGEFSGDPRRVYLTGNSMGGFGTWFLAAKHPGTFAALAPICGGVRPPSWVPVPAGAIIVAAADPYQEIARRIGPTPAWIFHGADDWLVPPTESRRMAWALRARATGEVRYTEYPRVGHSGAYEITYERKDLGRWFLQHSLP